ncbi:MAG: hypothetical protein ABI178_02175 [Rhodanobacter sp.]
MINPFRTLAIAVALSIVIASLAMPANANETYSSTPVLGGNGGGSFNGYCGRREVMTGIVGRTGAWLDAIAPLCAGYGHGPRFDPPRRGPWTGGGGGGSASQECPSNAAVRGWEIGRVRHNGFVVGYVRLICLSLDTGAETRNGQRFGGQGFIADADVMTYRCPAGQVAVGVYGHSGAFIDNAGLLCDTPSLIFGRPTTR